MKTTLKRAGWLKHAALVTMLGAVSGQASAALVNTDFAAGFDNWNAEVIDGNFNVDSGNIFTSYASNFILDGSEVTLQPGFDGTREIWSVTIFQDFMLDPLGSQEKAMLSLSVASDLSSSDDFIFVQLRDLATDDVLDLSAGGSFDISQWAGLNATFEFGLQDGDFNLADTLSISEISFSTTQVPEPGALSLMVLGLLAGARGLRKN